MLRLIAIVGHLTHGESQNSIARLIKCGYFLFGSLPVKEYLTKRPGPMDTIKSISSNDEIE
jgi:hypothetical protein